MTNWHESPLMIVKSADPTKLGGSAMGISIKDFVHVSSFIS